MQIRLATDGDLKRRKLRDHSSKTAAAGSASKEKVQSPFLDILNQVLPPDIPENADLHDLWSRLPDAERRLLESQSDENLAEYRELVKRITEKSLDYALKLKVMTKKNRKKDTIQLNLVEIIDEKLHKMALMIQSRKNTAFSILKALDEIRGLLLDARQ